VRHTLEIFSWIPLFVNLVSKKLKSGIVLPVIRVGNEILKKVEQEVWLPVSHVRPYLPIYLIANSLNTVK
jgi:hypothetical protein